jgi:hypothetical protein
VDLPRDADKRQRNFFKDNRITERLFNIICEEHKVGKEAKEIIKEIARKAESPWETEYFEDKSEPEDYRIDQEYLPYKGFAVDWIEDIRMLFWRLEHRYTWCDFTRIFETVDKDEEEVKKWKDEGKRKDKNSKPFKISERTMVKILKEN